MRQHGLLPHDRFAQATPGEPAGPEAGGNNSAWWISSALLFRLLLNRGAELKSIADVHPRRGPPCEGVVRIPEPLNAGHTQLVWQDQVTGVPFLGRGQWPVFVSIASHLPSVFWFIIGAGAFELQYYSLITDQNYRYR